MFQTPSDLIGVALDLLPPMPSTIEVVADNGGVFALALSAHEGDVIYAYGDRDYVRDGASFEARLRDEEGDGHNIRFSIIRTYFQSGSDLLVHLHVTGIEEHSATRIAKRAHLTAQAKVQVLFSRSSARGELFEVRLADASTTGVAFITDRRLEPADTIELTAEVADTSVRLEARVVRVIPAIYGRNRIGCEITSILEADRHALGLLSMLAEQSGSEDDRRPELVAELERARRVAAGARTSRRVPYA